MMEISGQPDNLTDVLAGELRAERARKKVSQVTLAQAIDRGQSYVSDRLNGHADWTVEEYVAICQALGVEPDEFLARVLSLVSLSPRYALAADIDSSPVSSETDEGFH